MMSHNFQQHTAIAYTALDESVYQNHNQKLLVGFYLHVHHDIDKAILEFEYPLPSIQGNLTCDMLCMESAGYGKQWFCLIMLTTNDVNKLRYRYIVKSHLGVVQRFANAVKNLIITTETQTKETQYRLYHGNMNQYDVFRHPRATGTHQFKLLFAGQFFYVKMLYDRISGDANLEKILIESDHVGFGDIYMDFEEEKCFFEWVNEASLKSNLNPHRSAYICSLLGRFNQRYSSSNILTPLDQKAAHILLTQLRRCPKDLLPQSSLDFIKCIHLRLLLVSSYRSNLQYIWLFGRFFDTQDILRIAKTLPVTGEDHFDDLVMQLFLDGIQDQLIAYIISNAPSIPSLWKIYNRLSNDAKNAHTGAFIEKFKSFTRVPSPDILNARAWRETPRSLKSTLAVPFCERLTKQVERKADYEQRSLVDLVLDKYLQEYAFPNLLQLLEILSTSLTKKNLDVLWDIFNAQDFCSFWQKTDDTYKSHIVRNLTYCKVQSMFNTQTKNKERVVAAFRIIEELSKVSILNNYVKEVGQWVCSEIKCKCGLKAIVDAYDEVRKSTSQLGERWYMDLLMNSINENSGINSDTEARLLDTIFPSNKVHIDGGRQKILLTLLDRQVHFTKLSHEDPQAQNKLIKAVLSEKKFWTIIFQATGKVKLLHDHQAYLTVNQMIESLGRDIIDGKIPLHFLGGQKDRMDLAELLALKVCSIPGIDGRGTECWNKLLASLSKEREEISKQFHDLERTIALINEITDERSVVILQDKGSIIEKYNALKAGLGNARFLDIREVNYWGELQCLLTVFEDLNQLSSCTIFKNFSRKLLQGQVTSKQQNNLTDKEEAHSCHISIKVEEVLERIKDGVETFVDVFNKLDDKEGQVPSQELDGLLSGIKEDDIKTEVLRVCEILKLKAPPMETLKMLQHFVKFEDVRKQVEAAVNCLVSLGYTADSKGVGGFLHRLQTFLGSKDSGTLRSIASQMEDQDIVKLSHQLEPDLVDILIELSQAKELIEFIVKTANDNMVDLIEAVEEHSDQVSQETTVSYLIDVHRFLRGLLTNKPEEPEKFLEEISTARLTLKEYSFPNKRRSKSNIKENDSQRGTKMAAKIKVCSCNVHSLEGLHTMFSGNKGEMTKEIIKSAIDCGRYRLEIEQTGEIHVLLMYPRNGKNKSEAKYNLEDLNDLRSRAHLIINAENTSRRSIPGREEQRVILQEELNAFIKQVDLTTEIVRKYKVLKGYGIPKYQKSFWKILNSTEEIIDEEKRVKREVEEWKAVMDKARKQHFFLNYFHAKQLWLIKSFFHEKGNVSKEVLDEVLALFHSIDTRITQNEVSMFPSKYKKPTDSTDESELNAIGKALDDIFRSSFATQARLKIDGFIKSGELYINALEPGSVQTVHVIMALFKNTCGRLPQPSEVLFCHPQTTWEEMELLLLRTFEAHRHDIPSRLHCIANVETLPNDIQFKLVESLKRLTSDAQVPYLLALVCRGGPHHYIADQFCDYVHFFGGIPDSDLKELLKQSCPETFLVTGDLPGLGKSEEIYSDAASKGRAVATFPISGPFVRNDLVKRLSQLKRKTFQSIRFNIGEVDDPTELDTFLFELIVTKRVSSEALVFSLPTENVYIEIANTLQQTMRNSLSVCKCFKKLEVSWKNYDNLLSSEELTSPIQVVCRYLDAYDRKTLENQEVSFSDKTAKALSSDKCKALLEKHFYPRGDLSFNILEIFISVLADQLMNFTRSPYFKPQHLKDMFDDIPAVRTRLFKALLDVATNFAARSVNSCKSIQANAAIEVKARNALDELKAGAKTTANQMVDRVKEMIKWTENEHLVIMLHGAGAITAIYSDLKNVPHEVKDLFESQAVHGKGLDDYTKMSQEKLQMTLEKISDAPKDLDRSKLASLGYALTPDNILKMALIIQRMQANIPVIVMGETGCGKTSLVRYLAQTCSIPFESFSFHAGITEAQIYDFINAKDKEARELLKEGKSMWVFLDEINTCDYLGIINEIVCHRSIHGKPLASNLRFVAACNPYRLRPPESTLTAGLTGKTKTDEFSKLVYRVHPLPETMIDYVWDYGSLSPEDERAYIGRMVEKGVKAGGKSDPMLVDLLAASQEFLRSEEKNSFCVSLRDVNRTTMLIKWFYSMLNKRQPVKIRKLPEHIRTFFITAGKFDNSDKAIVLSLAHCYLSRLPTSESRQRYCKKMSEILIKHGRKEFSCHSQAFQQIIRAEQEDYLFRMELPEGTAKNAALRENVFVILVCILNRIPVFVVGKPGCSKSLSMQIIKSNLRGRDSKERFLKTLPQLFVISFQGSESSTSEGIEKVFEKARKYKTKAEDVLPVVLLDEIGLAEISKFNPLKVLHRLLEPGDGRFPDVAVVGISNWALDAAKMNRAIHLSRPEPDQDDLYDTGLSIREALVKVNGGHLTKSAKFPLQCLAEAYHQYQSKQKHENFHGLRDYYAMVKCLDTSGDPGKKNEKIQCAMERNFGGITAGKGELQSAFLEKLKANQPVSDVLKFPVTDLIRANLKDRMARHLLIITSRDSAIEILEQTLKDLNKEKMTIFGSRFEEDQTADYSHRILSRIILCMERDCILILRDLERIYGSLYDMLNQNYIIVGGKKNCRVALGAYSNPMCQVADGFRCIVLVDEDKIDYSDPPFLNRFEKQLLRFSDVLSVSQREMIKELEEWAERISTVEGHETDFDEEDMFGGFHDDTLPSLLLYHSQDMAVPKEEVMHRCKQDLMSIAMPDAVVRMRNSKLCKIDDEEVDHLYEDYFKKPAHDGLKTFLCQRLQKNESDCAGMKLVVMTHSSIHTDVSKCIDEGLFTTQVEKMSFFKSEKELSKRVKHFWMESSANLLVIQCRPETDARHMLLVKVIIERKRKSFIESFSADSDIRQKHVCIVIHLRRGVETECDGNHQRWQFNFLSGWNQVLIDALEKPAISITSMLECSVNELLQSETTISFSRFAADQLLWCFTRIKNPPSTQLDLEEISSLVDTIKSSPDIMEFLKVLCCGWVNDELNASTSRHTWQIDVACDRQTLINSSTLEKAFEYYISHLIRRPLARIVYFLHRNSAWKVFTTEDANTRKEYLQLLSSKSVLKIEDIPEPQDAESLVVDVVYPDLNFPFSCLICKKVDNLYGIFDDEYHTQRNDKDNLDKNEELTKDAMVILTRKIATKIEQAIKEIIASNVLVEMLPQYVDDFLDIKSESVSNSLSRQQRLSTMKAHYGDQLPIVSETDPRDVSYVVAQLHTTFWLNGNALPDLFYFIQAFMQTNSLTIDDCLTRYFEAKEEHKQAALSTQLDDTFGEEDDDNVAQHEQCEEHEEQESVDDEEDPNNPLEPSFEQFVVQEVCFAFLPKDTFIKNLGGLKEWKNVVSLVLSSATKYCSPVPVFYYLKVCDDFASLILPESEPYRMFILGELVETKEDSFLDSKEVFNKICELVQELREEGQNEKKLQEFEFLFFERCIQSNPDSDPLIGKILSKIMTSEGDHLLSLASSILHQIILTEEEAFSLQNVDNLIASTNLDEFPNLIAINDAFTELACNETKELDCPICVICCDLITKLAFSDLDIQKVDNSDDPAMNSFHKAMDALSRNDDECKTNMFGLICAVAYIRVFMSELSRLVSEYGIALDLEQVLKDVCFLLKGNPSGRMTSVFTFLLKELGQKQCLYDIKEMLQTYEVLHPLKSLACEDGSPAAKLSYDPFQALARNSEAETALGLHVKESDSKHLKSYLDSAMSSRKKRMEFASVMAAQFYVTRSIRKLNDTEDQAAKSATNLPSVSHPYQSFIMRISGQESYSCAELEISPESNAIDVQVAVLVQHLSAILASGFLMKSKHPVICCQVSPGELKDSYVLAAPETHSGYSTYKHFQKASYSKVAFYSCDCGMRLAGDESSDMKCTCSRNPPKEKGKETESAKCSKGYINCSVSDLKNELLHVRNLKPIEFRVLHLIIHSALYAGYSLGLSKDVLSDVMKTQNPSDTCYQAIHIDLDVMSNILCCKKETTIALMHRIFEEISPLLTEEAKPSRLHNENARLTWERRFSEQMKPILEKFRKHGLCSTQLQTDNNAKLTLESVIEERTLVNFPDVSSRNKCIPRLFRTTQPNTLSKLREVYTNSPNEVKARHPLLGLFLDYNERLHLVGNLVSLLSWSRRVDCLLTRSLNRSKAKEMKIVDVFTKEQQVNIQPEIVDLLRSEFENFRKAWENVVPMINTKLQESEEMPYISEMHAVGYCLAEWKDLGRYLCTSLNALAELQNEFLDKCLQMATNGKCSALKFLSKKGSVCCLPTVHVQDAIEKEIIQYEWSDKFLGHSLHNTEYGQGNTVKYDMDKIEKDMAGNFLLGKAYLSTSQGIREFVFSKQLFHDCANILNELNEVIPQVDIPDSVKAELERSSAKSIDRIQILLEHLELVLCYLKRTGSKPDESLVDYVDTWMSSSRPFPKDLFPETLNAVKVKHVCALYEFVEDQLAVQSVQCVANEYRKPVLKGTEEKMKLASKEEGTFVLKAVVTAIKRFVFRYLHTKPHSDECLVEFMKDPSLWPMALTSNGNPDGKSLPEIVLEVASKLFPQQLTVGNVYTVCTLYQEGIEKVNVRESVQRTQKRNKKRNYKAGGFS